MMKLTRHILLAVFLLVLCVSAASAEVITPELEQALTQAAPGDNLPVIITLKKQVDIATLKKGLRALKRSKLIRKLKDAADQSQPELIGFLQKYRTKGLKRLWLVNGIVAGVPAGIVADLARHPAVARIQLDFAIRLDQTAPQAEPSAPEWNIQMVRAPELWAMGYRGQGVVVASMDTGVDVSHPDLQGRFRGGANSWYDPNGEHLLPDDLNGHGTRTMGLIVGGDHGGSAIGMAPEANFIAVKIFNDANIAQLSAIHLGFQWLLDPDGNPDTDDAPDIVNNSWGFESLAGTCFNEFHDDISVLRQAGIAVVFAAGNTGPAENTSVSPANNAGSMAVGAVDGNMDVSLFSAAGPCACEKDIYPELVAPGVMVKTSDLTYGGVWPDSYAWVSGTSFAAPHLTGAMALLLSAHPGLTVAELENAFLDSAFDLGPAGADHDYGYGMVDAMAAWQAVPPSAGDCTDADGDGFFAGSTCTGEVDCNDADPLIHPGALEIKHDGVDQDCNGYDLTIDIIRALYLPDEKRLVIEAASSLGADASLALSGYGSMVWNSSRQTWLLFLKNVGEDPGQVTVSGVEGSETSLTTVYDRKISQGNSGNGRPGYALLKKLVLIQIRKLSLALAGSR